MIGAQQLRDNDEARLWHAISSLATSAAVIKHHEPGTEATAEVVRKSSTDREMLIKRLTEMINGYLRE